MQTSLLQSGKVTFRSEVTNITSNGFWILLESEQGWKEYFVSFHDYPGFAGATIAQVLAVELTSPGHLYWNDLDVDIEVDSLCEGEKYPLIYR